MDISSNFDLGPLIWVKGEIDNAMQAAVTVLETWNGQDSTPLQEAATHLHQVSGALQIVDLQGLFQVNDAIEGLLSDMQTKEELRNPDSAAVVLRAIKAMGDYLEDLMAGGPNNELLLNPVYSEVQGRRGGEPPSPSALFYPDLGMRAKRPSAELPLDDQALARAVRSARSRYQKGLLNFLQDNGSRSGLQLMEQAVREIEKLAPGAAQYTFWWSAVGAIEALQNGRLEPDIWIKRMLARVDLQMRRLMEGSRQLADRLFRDVLYFLSQDSSEAGRTQEARELFELDRYAVHKPSALEQKEATLRPRVNALRDTIGAAKEQWMRLCAGRPESLEPFRTAAKQVQECVEQLPEGPLAGLSTAIREVAEGTASSGKAVENEALQVEMATALLLLQHAAETYFNMARDFPELAEVQGQRLRSALAGEGQLPALPGAQLLDEIARQAQERLLTAQVTHEIQTNLHQVEEILDKFFRNSAERANLPVVPGLLKQIQGALNILQLDIAADLVQATQEHVARISEADAETDTDELNWIAEAISTLGLYVEALRNGQDDPTGIRTLLAPPEVAKPEEVSVEQELEESAERLQEFVGRLAETPDQAEVRQEIRQELTRFARDADLVGDGDLAGRASETLRLIDENASAESIQTAIRGLSGSPPVPAAAEPLLPAADEQEVDAELLQIYIEEAKEVLATIGGHLEQSSGTTLEHEAFVEIRRGFHTLKGSGRMVGLTELAEVAWEVEQTMNLWIRDERTVNRAMFDFVNLAVTAFQGWVVELENSGTVEVQPEQVVTQARQLRGETEAPEPVQPTEAPPVVAPEPEAEPETEIEQEAESEPGVEPVPDAELELVALSEPEAEAEPEPEVEKEVESELEAGMVTIGQHAVPAPLFDIFTEEAAGRLEDLRNHLVDLSQVGGEQVWDGFARAAHTLAGIARTTGFAPMAETAHAVENWATAWPAKYQVLAEEPHAAMSGVLEELQAQLRAILDHHWPDALTDLQARLESLRPEADKAAAEEVSEPELPAREEPQPETEAVSVPLAEGVTEPLPPAEPLPTVEPSPPEEPLPQAVTPAPDQDECDPELLPIFLAEADELLPKIGESLRGWRERPADREICQALQRSLHTLKGSARMAGAMRLGDDAHEMETHIVEWGEAAPDDAFLDQLEHRYDGLAEQVDHLRAPIEPVMPQAAEAGEAVVAPAVPVAAAPSVEEVRSTQPFRAHAGIVDSLINEASEVSIARARIEAAVGHYRQTAQELTANVERLRSQLRELELQAETQIGARMSQMDASHFDPLEFDRYTRLQELTRLMAESVNDVSTAQENLVAGLSDAEYALLVQARTTRGLQQELMHIRMVRINSQAERLHRIVRQAARELGRNARLHIEGGDIELDRTVLDKAMAPFEHLLRNAVAHGIETPEVRLAAGKPEYGSISLAAHQEGTEVVVTLSDDGAGIRLDKIRARAEDLGWVQADEKVGSERLESFLFMPGFSTVDAVTQVAGRGVGLDVVRSEIASVGGRVRLESELGRGTRFTIRLPATLALSQVVLASAGDQVYSMPAAMVVLVKEMRDKEWNEAVAAGQVELEEQVFPLHSLAELTGQRPNPTEGRYRTVLLLRSGDERVALRVDELKGNAEVVVKPIGPQLARVPGVAGATVLTDGKVSLILNPFALIEQAPSSAMQVVKEAMAKARPPLILVVDDSLTVRKITGRLLHREGYRVETAKDGIEALEALEEEMPAVMLLDIEMPRMDGFEVARHVRADSLSRNLPIIMITSRTADKHRQHAFELGVNEYMGKPYQEDALLATIASMVANRPTS